MMAATITYKGKAPDVGAEQSALSSPIPPTPTIDVSGALKSAQNALADLLASSGYKNARMQNRSDAIFYGTYAGKCELEIKATIKKLGG